MTGAPGRQLTPMPLRPTTIQTAPARRGSRTISSAPKGSLERHHERTRRRGVNRPLLLLAHLTLRPLILLIFRLGRTGRDHLPARGPVLLAANHRSFLDPWLIACCAHRPLYFMAKRELFDRRLLGRVLNALGAFPVRRGESDETTMETARLLLERGEAVVVYPEGARIRRGSLRRPRPGVGRLALETGAPVVPIAVLGSERARRRWRIRPVRIRVRCGRPLTFPRVERPSSRLAAELSERVWPYVALQWEWLGGLPPLRTAAVVGAGSMGTAIAVLLARAGLDVQLGCRGADQAVRLREEGANAAYLPDAELPESLRVTTTAEVEFGGIDLVVLAVPSREVPQVVAQVGARVGGRSAVLLLAKGLVAPLGSRPTDYVQARVAARAVAYLGGPAHAAETVSHGAAVVLASADEDLRQQLAGVLARAGLSVEQTDDVIGAELGGCAKNAATLAASVAATVSNNAAGGAAGRVFAEAYRLAIGAGARPETLVGLAGVGDLVGTALAPVSRNRRAGELLAEGIPAERVPSVLGCAAESLDAVPLLVGALDQAGVDCPATRGLAALVAGETTAERWIEELEAGRPAGGGASPGPARLASDG